MQCCTKISKKYVRNVLVASLNSSSLESMCGGFQHRACDFVILWQSLYHEICEARKWSSTRLYLDLRVAFASAYRALIAPNRISHEVLVRFAQKFGFRDEHSPELCE